MTAAARTKSRASPPPGQHRLRALLASFVRAGLALLLLFQLVFLLKPSWPVPEFLLAAVESELAVNGLDGDWKQMRFLLPAKLAVDDIRLREHADDGRDFLAIDSAQLQLSLRGLLTGESVIDNISFYGASLHCPARLSPTGRRELLVEQLHAVFRDNRDSWSLESAAGNVFGIQIAASGRFPKLPDKPAEPIDWRPIVEEWLPELVRGRDQIRAAENPAVRIRLLGTGNGELRAETLIFADRIELPEEVQIESPLVALAAHFDGDSWRPVKATVTVPAAIWAGRLRSDGMRGLIVWPGDSPADRDSYLPERIEISANRIGAADGLFSADGLHAIISPSPDSPRRANVRFMVFSENEPVQGTGFYDWEHETGELAVRSRINPTPFLQHSFARELGLKRDLYFHEPVHASGWAKIERGELMEATARAFTGRCEIDGVVLDRAVAQLEFVPHLLHVPEMVLAFEDFETIGSYELDPVSRDYRLFFKGSLRPMHISSWFNDWWPDFWQDFSFAESPLEGDVEIRSVHGRPEEVEVTGSARAEHFFLRGAPFAAAKLNLFVTEYYADLFDVELVRQEGVAKGRARIWQDPETGDLAKLRFHVDSTLDLGDIAQVFDDDGREILSSFRFTEPPEFAAAGIVTWPPREEGTHVVLRGKTNAPLEYENVALDHLTIDGHIDGRNLILSTLSGGIAGGEFTGNLQKWSEGERDLLDFALRIVDADLEIAIAALSDWDQEGAVTPENAGEPAEGDGERRLTGILDLDVNASGLYGNPHSFSGNGRLAIRDANLAEIHLLGILSRILRTTPLGFTSLEFNDANARFQIEKETIRVEEMLVTGPTTTISGSGDYVIPEQNLDFNIKVHLLRQSRIPLLAIVLSPLTESLAHALEVRLTGTIDEPEWRFLLGPRNLLEGISTPNRNEERPRPRPTAGAKADDGESP